jgi:hypothetical protein
VVTAGVLVQLARDALLLAGVLPLPVSFDRSVAVRLATLVLLVAAGFPQVTAMLGPSGAELAATLRRDSYTLAEAEQQARGYYEEIADARVPASPWLDALRGKDTPPAGDATHYIEMTRPTDELQGRELIPGWSGNLAGGPITVNGLGMRDREGITRHKPADTCRIALVGSSVVMGYGVGDDQVFKCLVEERLNAAAPAGGPHYELLNFGTGMSSALHRRVLVERRVFAFQPDALYYFAHQDELLNPVRHLARLHGTGTPLPYPCLEDVVRRAGITPGTAWGAADIMLRPRAREVLLCIYRGLVEECRARGILPVWVYLPMPGIVEVSIKSSEVVSVASEAGFVVLNLADWADGYAPGDVKLSPADHHPNARGHQVIAERLFAALRRRPELLPESARLKP